MLAVHAQEEPTALNTSCTVQRVATLCIGMLAMAFVSSWARAVGIGEFSLFSRLGEPIDAVLEVQPGKGEVIDDSCLSLSAADKNDAVSSAVLARSGLTLRLMPSRDRIEIRSKKPLNDPVAVFRVEIRCKGQASVSRIVTLLPEPGPRPVTTKASAAVQAAPTFARTAIPHSAPRQQDILPAGSKALSGVMPAGGQSQFELNLSTDPLDLSRIGTLSASDRESILAQRKLMDVDDQTAYLLSMQKQMQAMREENQSLRHKVASLELGLNPDSAQASRQDAPWITAQTWRNILMLLGALSAMAVAIFGIRQVRALKARLPQPEPTSAETEESSPATMKHIGESTTINIVYPAKSKQTETSKFMLDEIKIPPAEHEQDTQAEEKAVLEEAELYAVYGHADKAIKILQEFVAQFPKSENAWLLLLSIHSSKSHVREFETAARKFLAHNQHSPLWKTIQALGRTLDKDNELYLDQDGTGKNAQWSLRGTVKQRPIGDILIDLGYLSVQDMRNCLGEFDPKQHGRFGNYLLTRRMINHAQLNEALLLQQSASDEPAAEEPSSPEQAEMPDTGGNLLNDGPAAKNAEPDTSSTNGLAQDKAFPIDFVIDDHTTEAAVNEEPAIPVMDVTSPLQPFIIDFDPAPGSDKPKEELKNE